MRMKFCCIFIIMLILQTAYQARANSTRYIVGFTSEYSLPVYEYRLEKIYDNTYFADDLNYLNDLKDYIKYIEPDDIVELIEPTIQNRKVRIYSSMADSNAMSETWQLEMVNANYAWDMGTFGNDINVAVIDSGCNNHIDLGNNLAAARLKTLIFCGL